MKLDEIVNVTFNPKLIPMQDISFNFEVAIEPFKEIVADKTEEETEEFFKELQIFMGR